MKVKRLCNISDGQIEVVLTNGTTIFLPPRQVLENIDIGNYTVIANKIRAELVLTEPKESKGGKGKQYLKG
jgi:hypothetical protein